MKELISFLIDELQKRPATRELLLVVSAAGALFLLFQFLLPDEPPLSLLQNQYLQAAGAFFLFSWLSTLAWRYARFILLRISVTSLLFVCGLVSAFFILTLDQVSPLPVRIFFDQSVDIDNKALLELADIFQSSLISLEGMSDSPYQLYTADAGVVLDNEVRNSLHINGLLRPQEADTKDALTILITARTLESTRSGWSNLLMITWLDGAVLSIKGIGDSNSIADEKVKKYIATTVVLQAIMSQAQLDKVDLLDGREPDRVRGCLYDFHRTRETYAIQSQQPKLCLEEQNAIEKHFGAGVVREIEKIFSRIARL